jgi:hypothetical protein
MDLLSDSVERDDTSRDTTSQHDLFVRHCPARRAAAIYRD